MESNLLKLVPTRYKHKNRNWHVAHWSVEIEIGSQMPQGPIHQKQAHFRSCVEIAWIWAIRDYFTSYILLCG